MKSSMNNIRRYTLWPLALVYRAGLGVDQSRKIARRFRSRLPVISVGNISVGGSGKTPLVQLLIERLQQENSLLVLSRGYGRKDSGPVIWRNGDELPSPDLIGDEPALLSRGIQRGGIAVASDRARLLEEIEGDFAGHIALMDDGFQHLQLERDLDIVIVDDRTARGSRLLPAGDLREPPAALRRAHLILTMSDAAAAFADRWKSDSAQVFRTSVNAYGISNWNTPSRRYERYGDSMLLVTGIAGPERVTAGLARLGLPVAGAVRFRDHHPYSAEDVGRILRKMKEVGAENILTTTKDAVKLCRFPELDGRLFVIDVRMEIEGEMEFLAAIRSAVRAKQESADFQEGS